MRRRAALIATTLGVAVLVAVAAHPAFAAGFAIYEQGAKAMGMADAFTAQADDGSAMFYNAGGLAFLTDRSVMVGADYIHTTTADFKGANPFPGDGSKGTQKALSVFPPHAYYVQPISSTWKVGIGVETPFGLTTQWQNPNTFPGRFISTKASLNAFDLNPTIAWQVNPDFGIGVGGIARFSNLELRKDLGAVDPFTQDSDTIAGVDLKGDYNEGYGFDIGFLYKLTPQFSLGGQYRSAINIDYSGHANFSQIGTGDPVFDQLVSAQLPAAGRIDAKTALHFPATASLGLGFGVTPSLFVEFDGGWAGWSRFEDVPIIFPNGEAPGSTIAENWKDSYNYRLGVRWTLNPVWQVRFGYVYDQTPQPDAAVNPLLPDNNRNGITVGFGYKGHAINTDFALMYLDFGSRTRNVTFPNDTEGDFFGTYQTKALLAALTVSF
jgi:long-chain fatty acid transport protein